MRRKAREISGKKGFRQRKKGSEYSGKPRENVRAKGKFDLRDMMHVDHKGVKVCFHNSFYPAWQAMTKEEKDTMAMRMKEAMESGQIILKERYYFDSKANKRIQQFYYVRPESKI